MVPQRVAPPSFTTETLFAGILDNSPNGVIAYEAVRNEAGAIIDYRTLYYNQQVLVISGHTPEEMMNQ